MSALAIGGWHVFAHPLFLDQLERLVAKVEGLRSRDPRGYRAKRPVKLLAAILKVAFEDIPSDPTRDVYRLGDTLGPEYRHWFRAKFLQQYRLFFRYQRQGSGGIVVLGWVNDDTTLRAYESASDAYAIFARMLAGGHPPDDWDALLAEAAAETAAARLGALR